MADQGRDRAVDRRTFLRRAAGVGAFPAASGVAGAKQLVGPRESGVGGTGSEQDPTAATVTDAADGGNRPWQGAPALGANLNGRPHRIANDLHLLDASNTTWVRAFLDVRAKRDDGTRPEDDRDVVALRRAVRERDCRLIVSLKWDFAANWRWDDKEPAAVPRPESERERDLLLCAARYLGSIGAPVDVVVLGNEPMWETRRADVRGEEPPVVEFTRRVKDYLVRDGDHGSPDYLVGAFNRLSDDGVREERFGGFCRGMFRLARENDVDGVDLHVHYDGFDDARRALAVARDRVPDGRCTVTEFSPAHRYDRHVRTPVGAWRAGRRFASEYGYPPTMTAVDYFERAKDDPRPPSEVGAFYAAMPWYRGDHLERTYRLFEQFDVGVGTFGFLQDAGMRHVDWRRPEWTPFHVNFLYQDALIRGDGAHPLYFDDYRRLAAAQESEL